MSESSAWPETPGAQAAVAALGAACLLPGFLRFVNVVYVSDTAVVGGVAVASLLLVYALLGWAGTWVERGDADPGDTEAAAAESSGGEGPTNAS